MAGAAPALQEPPAATTPVEQRTARRRRQAGEILCQEGSSKTKVELRPAARTRQTPRRQTGFQRPLSTETRRRQLPRPEAPRPEWRQRDRRRGHRPCGVREVRRRKNWPAVPRSSSRPCSAARLPTESRAYPACSPCWASSTERSAAGADRAAGSHRRSGKHRGPPAVRSRQVRSAAWRALRRLRRLMSAAVAAYFRTQPESAAGRTETAARPHQSDWCCR